MHVFVGVLNWIKCEGESAGSWCWNEQDGLMCSQQTASDPSSACLNWAPGFIQCGVYLQYAALYKPLLHRRPLQRGHCSSFIHPWMHSWTVHGHGHTNSHGHTCAHDTHCCWADLCRGLNWEHGCTTGVLGEQIRWMLCIRQTSCVSRRCYLL